MAEVSMQKLVDTLGQISRDDRTKYHLTLGKLIEILEEVPEDYVIVIDDSKLAPGDVMSYRGYYSDLSFDRQYEPRKVGGPGGFLGELKEALNSTFEGYKGGDFYMDEGTPLWISEYGTSEGLAIMDLTINKDEGYVSLKTKSLF